ncbi:Transposase, Ptta/En/Spm, plant [Corchorus olitorius]|uniref:Transposase, Ptta/En/Spm, plant n=1 Tax=Corchorus olitorius TaxID=93759 RepID=A0A1R3GQP9_9ROSI|nr:Transposase, Ptta/En/Spm, plant [Corchorus olitorius]
MFETIKVYYTWPKSREKEVRSVFGRLASDHIRRQFQIARETLHIPNPGWEQNKKNRNTDGFASTSGYRGGRISTYTHRQRFIIEKSRKPTRVELYERTHGNRKNGTYPPSQTAITMAKFNAALERAKEAAGGDQERLRAIDEDAIFDEVAGGTKGRRLGLGNIARAERCGVVDPCSSLTQENQQLRETIKSLSQDNEATKAKQIQSDQKLDKLQEYLQTMCAALAQQNINFLPLRILEQVSESSRTTRQQPQQPGPVENSPDKDNNIQDEDLEAHDDVAPFG